jgi:hypothetical protein
VEVEVADRELVRLLVQAVMVVVVMGQIHQTEKLALST